LSIPALASYCFTQKSQIVDMAMSTLSSRFTNLDASHVEAALYLFLMVLCYESSVLAGSCFQGILFYRPSPRHLTRTKPGHIRRSVLIEMHRIIDTPYIDNKPVITKGAASSPSPWGSWDSGS
jgi:hypothetical protein